MMTKMAQVMATQLETGIMAKLNEISDKLDNPKEGLIGRTNTLEVTSKTMFNTLYTKQTGLLVRVNQFEETLNTGPNAVTTVLKKHSTIVNTVPPLETTVTNLHVAVNNPSTGLSKHMLTVEEAFSSPEKSSSVLCRKLATIEKSLWDGQQPGIALVDDEEIRENKRKIDELQDRVMLTADIVNGVARKMDSLKRQVLINQAKISSNDLIIGGIRVEIEEGEEEEDVKAATIKFLENKLSLKINPQELIEVSRGKFTTERVIRKKKVTIPPVMFVHTTESVRKLILRNTWKLKKLKDDIDFYGYYVKQSIPEEWRALRAKYQADYDEVKERNLAKGAGEPKEQCYFSQDKFYKHGEVIEECIKPPTPREMINMSAEIRQKVNDIPIICSQMLSEKYSTFRSYAVNVTTVEEVKLAYMQIKKTESTGGPYHDGIPFQTRNRYSTRVSK